MGIKASKGVYHIIKIRNDNIEFKENTSIIISCDDEYIIKSKVYNIFMKKNTHTQLFPSIFYNKEYEYEILVNSKSNIYLYCITQHSFTKIFHRYIIDDYNLKLFI